MKKIPLILVMFLIYPTLANANSCISEELNELTSKSKLVTAYYEIEKIKYNDGEYFPPDSYTDEEREEFYSQDHYYSILNVMIENVSSDFYIKTYNSSDNEVNKYFGDENNKVKYRHYYLWDVTTLTIEVYISDNSNCNDELVRTFNIDLPRYNFASNYEVCDDLKDELICSEFTFMEYLTESEFISEYQMLVDKSEVEEKEMVESSFEKILGFVKSNLLYISIIIAVFVVVVLAVLKLQKKRGDIIEKNN